MPEIGEVARVVHYLRKHLVGRTIKTCEAFEDEIVYGKVGTSAKAFQSAVHGRKVTSAAQQGKYFYVTFDRPPHAVMHFGMTGWMKFNCEDTHYYKQAREKDGKEAEEWPPRFMKFMWKCEKEQVEGEQKDAVEVAFVDARRLARIRLVDCEEEKIREHTPLKENGPDPVRDKDIVTVDWLAALLRKKRVPVKALLLDQANLSGVGNWVADEVLYQARIHPEQYSNTFDEEQVKRLHDALTGVCTIAVQTLADSRQFPDTWLMKYRWNKGKKDSNTLPNGEKIVHLKVGGRTSAIVPSVQKKTAAVAGDVDAAELADEDEKPAKGRKRKSKVDDGDEDEEEAVYEKPAKRGRGNKAKDELPAKKVGRGKKAAANGVKVEDDAEEGENNGDAQQHDDPDHTSTVPAKARRGKIAAPKKAEKGPAPESRRSARTKAK